MKKLTGKQIFLIILTLIALVLSLFVKKAAIFILLLAIGFLSNFIIFKMKLPWNLTANFFLSILIIHFYGILEFFIFLFVADILPRPFTGREVPRAAYMNYAIWIILAVVSLNFSDNLVLIGIVITVLRYILAMISQAIGGMAFIAAIFRNVPQLVINILLFAYITDSMVFLLG